MKSQLNVRVYFHIDEHSHKRLANHTTLGAYTCEEKGLVLGRGGESYSENEMTVFVMHLRQSEMILALQMEYAGLLSLLPFYSDTC